MLIRALTRAKFLLQNGHEVFASDSLNYFMKQSILGQDLIDNRDEILNHYIQLDDVDIMSSLKKWSSHDDKVLALISKGLVNRRLFRIEIQDVPFDDDIVQQLRDNVRQALNDEVTDEALEYLVFTGSESNRTYSKGKQEIKVSFKKGEVMPISEVTDFEISPKSTTKHYICYPKIINM
jgi:hypothetical protein